MPPPDKHYITIEVAHARPEQQRIVQLRVPAGTTARDAARQSELTRWFPALDLATAPLGVFGERVGDGQVLAPGARVELYRPLQTDPRTARRAAAERGHTLGRRGED